MLEFWFLLTQMHSLSRLSAMYSTLIIIVSLASIAVAVRPRLPRDVFVWVGVNLCMLLYLLWLEVFVSRELPAPGNIVRVATPFAIAIILGLSVRSLEQVARLSLIYVVVVLLGAASLYYQVVFGPVSWFADPSTRVGVTRYASLLGSLTIFGTAAPFAILCLARYVKSAIPFAVGAILLLAAAMLSLQKAALLGVAIALPFTLMLTARRTLVTTMFVAAVSITALMMLIPPQYSPYVEAGIGYFLDPSFEADDVSVLQSIFDRLTYLPAELIDALGWSTLLAGAGLRGAAGVFGFDDLPMSHNGIVDYVAVGGIVFLVYGLWICVRLALLGLSLPSMVRYGVIGRPDAVFLGGMTVLYLANLPFASGLQFHPNVSWVFALLIAAQMVLRREAGARFARTDSPSVQHV